MDLHRPVRANMLSPLSSSAAVNCSHLFALPPVKQRFVTLSDVRDAYDIASSISQRDTRQDVYASFGLDGQQVEKWYPVVEHLNACWNLPAVSQTQGCALPRMFFRMGTKQFWWNG